MLPWVGSFATGASRLGGLVLRFSAALAAAVLAVFAGPCFAADWTDAGTTPASASYDEANRSLVFACNDDGQLVAKLLIPGRELPSDLRGVDVLHLVFAKDESMDGQVVADADVATVDGRIQLSVTDPAASKAALNLGLGAGQHLDVGIARRDLATVTAAMTVPVTGLGLSVESVASQCVAPASAAVPAPKGPSGWTTGEAQPGPSAESETGAASAPAQAADASQGPPAHVWSESDPDGLSATASMGDGVGTSVTVKCDAIDISVIYSVAKRNAEPWLAAAAKARLIITYAAASGDQPQVESQVVERVDGGSDWSFVLEDAVAMRIASVGQNRVVGIAIAPADSSGPGKPGNAGTHEIDLSPADALERDSLSEVVGECQENYDEAGFDDSSDAGPPSGTPPAAAEAAPSGPTGPRQDVWTLYQDPTAGIPVAGIANAKGSLLGFYCFDGKIGFEYQVRRDQLASIVANLNQVNVLLGPDAPGMNGGSYRVEVPFVSLTQGTPTGGVAFIGPAATEWMGRVASARRIISVGLAPHVNNQFSLANDFDFPAKGSSAAIAALKAACH